MGESAQNWSVAPNLTVASLAAGPGKVYIGGLFNQINSRPRQSIVAVTSGLTGLSVVALYLFGGEVLRGFSLAMIWGIAIGTYSTIFVASPMLIYMHLRRDREAKPAPNAQGAAGAGGAARP